MRKAYSDEFRSTTRARLATGCNFISIPFLAPEFLVCFAHDLLSGFEYVGPWNLDTHDELRLVIKEINPTLDSLSLRVIHSKQLNSKYAYGRPLLLTQDFNSELLYETEEALRKIKKGKIHSNVIEKIFHQSEFFSLTSKITTLSEPASNNSQMFQMGYLLSRDPDSNQILFDMLIDSVIRAEKNNPSGILFDDFAQQALFETAYKKTGNGLASYPITVTFVNEFTQTLSRKIALLTTPQKHIILDELITNPGIVNLPDKDFNSLIQIAALKLKLQVLNEKGPF